MTTKMIMKLRHYLRKDFYLSSFVVGPATCFFVLLLSASAQESALTVDNLTVTEDAAVFRQLTVGFPDLTNGAIAIGGTISESGGYLIHTFTANGTFKIYGGSLTCEVLVVAGGGGGGYGGGGGGGAGGLVYTQSLVISGSTPVLVGEGGISRSLEQTPGSDGSNSVFGAIIAIGGGGGGRGGAGQGGVQSCNGADGGSGGGGGGYASISHWGGGTGTVGQGYSGGSNSLEGDYYGAGGGGGAGGPGGIGSSTNGGAGGPGVTNSISGSGVVYAAGGTGSGAWGGAGANGAANSGNGGDGGSEGVPGGGNYLGGRGGSGVVIVRYLLTSAGALVPTLIISSNGISQVSTSAVNVFMGKVGIGTESPGEKLHVSGNVRIDGSLTLGEVPHSNWPSGGGVAEGALIATNNLADLADVAAARTNLGLGTAATEDMSAFDAAGEAATVGSDLATHTGDFNNPHKVTAAQVGAVSTNAGALLAANNLSELSATAATARSNLGLGSAAINDASAFLSTGGGSVNGNVAVSGSVSVDAPSGDIPMGIYTSR